MAPPGTMHNQTRSLTVPSPAERHPSSLLTLSYQQFSDNKSSVYHFYLVTSYKSDKLSGMHLPQRRDNWSVRKCGVVLCIINSLTPSHCPELPVMYWKWTHISAVILTWWDQTAGHNTTSPTTLTRSWTVRMLDLLVLTGSECCRVHCIVYLLKRSCCCSLGGDERKFWQC